MASANSTQHISFDKKNVLNRSTKLIIVKFCFIIYNVIAQSQKVILIPLVAIEFVKMENSKDSLQLVYV